MAPIRAVIFDFGGVLVRTEDWSEHRKWETHLGLSEGELLKTVFGSEVSVRAMQGEVTVAELWHYVAGKLGLNAGQMRDLARDFWLNERIDVGLVEFLRSLRPRYKTAILSNALLDAREVFTQRYGLGEVVDEIIISSEEGIAKPASAIYVLAAQRLGVQPSEAIFVDDWLKSVEGARVAGMHAIQFESTEQTIADVKQYLEKIR